MTAVAVLLASHVALYAVQGYTPPPLQASSEFETSCDGGAADAVQTGIALLFLLEHGDARSAFEQAETVDPDCAIASWGRALAWLGLPDGEVSPAAEARARAAFARASSARHASERERAYIDATSRLLEPATASYASRVHAFALAARGMAARFPQDQYPTLLVALAHLALSSAPGDMGQREAATAIVLKLGEAPADAAAAALLVRARSNADDAESARPAALAVLRARPPSPRALQSAARLFQGLGAWQEAIDAGEGALSVAGGLEAAALAQEGRWPEHPLPWLVQAESAAGRFDSARRRLQEMQKRLEVVKASYEAIASWRLRAVLDISWSRVRRLEIDWQAAPESRDGPSESFGVAAGNPPGEEAPSTSDSLLSSEAQARRAWVEGLLAARAAWPRGEPERVAAARAAITTLERLVVTHPVPPRFELLRTEVQAALSAALEARDELALFEAHLTGLGQRLRVTADDVGANSGSEGLCGDLHMQLRDWFEASRCYAVASAAPRRARVLLGEARALRRLEQDDRISPPSG